MTETCYFRVILNVDRNTYILNILYWDFFYLTKVHVKLYYGIMMGFLLSSLSVWSGRVCYTVHRIMSTMSSGRVCLEYLCHWQILIVITYAFQRQFQRQVKHHGKYKNFHILIFFLQQITV